MAALILPRRFYSQPQYPVEIASIAKDFTHLFNFGSGSLLPENSVRRDFPLVNLSSLSMTSGPGGCGLQQANGGTNRVTVTGDPFAVSECTYLWVESANSVDTQGSVIADSRYSTTAAPNVGGFQVRITATNVQILKAQTASILTATNARSNGSLNICALTSRSGRQAIFSGGRLFATASSTETYTHGTSGLFNSVDVDNICFFGPIYLLAFAPKVLPDELLVELTANPWQILKARSRVLYFDVASGGIVTLNQATETDTAQAVGRVKYKAIGQIAETNSAQAISTAKHVAFVQAVEADTAQAITPAGSILAAVGQVQETDTAQAITASPIHRLLGQATEADAAQAITSSKTVAVAMVTESDSAQAIAAHTTKVVAVGQAQETGSAQAVSSRKTLAVGLVTETDFAQAVAAYKRLGILQLVETDSAHSIAAIKHVGVGQAIEADTAQAMHMPPELTPHTAAGGSLVRHLGASAISTHVNTATLIRH